MPKFEPEDIFLSLVHVALKLRRDLLEKPGHAGFEVSEEKAMNCIPESLYMFLKILYGVPVSWKWTQMRNQTKTRNL